MFLDWGNIFLVGLISMLFLFVIFWNGIEKSNYPPWLTRTMCCSVAMNSIWSRSETLKSIEMYSIIGYRYSFHLVANQRSHAMWPKDCHSISAFHALSNTLSIGIEPSREKKHSNYIRNEPACDSVVKIDHMIVLHIHHNHGALLI